MALQFELWEMNGPMYPSFTENQWQNELMQSLRSVSQLLQARLISPDEALQLQKLGSQYQVRLTPYYAGLMNGSKDCPIRKQAIPDPQENDPELPDWAKNLSSTIYGRPKPWVNDAIGDVVKLAAPRITHRYGNRAILHISSMCAVYCRFCFRKGHLNDDEKTLYEGSLDPAFQYLEKTQEIREIILTGGDPLSISDKALSRLLDRIHEIPHIRTVRIHSRMAVTLPSRFTESLLQLLKKPRRYQIVLVSHFNHPKELTSESTHSLKRLKQTGVTLLNQSVLLREINDSVETLFELFQGLYEAGVPTYYLHYPDWTPGTFHFRVGIPTAQKLVRELRGKLSGPSMPDLILDIPGGNGKISLLDSFVKHLEDFSDSLSKIDGAIWEVYPPANLVETSSPIRYLDLFKKA